MASNNDIKIKSAEEAKDIIQKRADAYEHIVQKASSLLQLIVGGLSVVAVLAAAGIITDLTSTIFEQDGIEALSTSKIFFSLLSAALLSFISIILIIGMIICLIGILTDDDYPGLIPPSRVISSGSSFDSSNEEYSDWLIEYACGNIKNGFALSEVRRDYRISVYSGVSSVFVLLWSILLISYLLDGERFAVLILNAMTVLVLISLGYAYRSADEEKLVKRDVKDAPTNLVIIPLVLIALFSLIAAGISILNLL